MRLLYCVPDGEERRILTERLFAAYWTNREDVTDSKVLLKIAKETGISSASGLNEESFSSAEARKELETATAEAIERGAFGVPGFWLPEARWTDVGGVTHTGRFFWGQDRMHFVEATLLSLRNNGQWKDVSGLATLMPRCIPYNQAQPSRKVKLEFWYDFSSPWAFLGYTQLPRLQRVFGHNLEIVMKPFLLGILFREIGAPNMPMLAVSPVKAAWSRQDHGDWTAYWNAVNSSQGSNDKDIAFHWADVFPIRTPTVLRVAIVEPATVPLLCEYRLRRRRLMHINIAQIQRVGFRMPMSQMRVFSLEYLTKPDLAAPTLLQEPMPLPSRTSCVRTLRRPKPQVSAEFLRTACFRKTVMVDGNRAAVLCGVRTRPMSSRT